MSKDERKNELEKAVNALAPNQKTLYNVLVSMGQTEKQALASVEREAKKAMNSCVKRLNKRSEKMGAVVKKTIARLVDRHGMAIVILHLEAELKEMRIEFEKMVRPAEEKAA